MKISVVMATYNAKKYLKEQLESILNQNYPIDELIIGDDLSKDGTIQLIEKYMLVYPNITLIKNKKNLGVNQNFMNLLKESTGDIVFFSDQDDVWEINKVSEILKKIKNIDQKSLIYSNNKVVDVNLKEIHTGMQFKVTRENLLDNLFFHNGGIQGCSMAITKELKNEILKYNSYSYMHDLLVSLYASCFADNIEYVDKSLFLYRQHQTNVIGYKINKYQRLKKIFQREYSFISFEVYSTILGFYKENEKKMNIQQKQKFVAFFKICNEKNYFKRNLLLFSTEFKFRNKKSLLYLKSMLSYEVLSKH